MSKKQFKNLISNDLNFKDSLVINKFKKSFNSKTLNLKKFNNRNLKFINIKFFINDFFKLNFVNLKKIKKIKKKKVNINLFDFLWQELHLFLLRNKNLIKSLLSFNLNIDIFNFLLEIFIQKNILRKFLYTFIKKKSNEEYYKLYKFIIFSVISFYKFELLCKKFFSLYIFFFYKYYNLKNFNINLILIRNISKFDKLDIFKLKFLKIFSKSKLKNKNFNKKRKYRKNLLKLFTYRRNLRKKNILFLKSYLRVNLKKKSKNIVLKQTNKKKKYYKKYLKFRTKKKLRKKLYFNNILKKISNNSVISNKLNTDNLLYKNTINLKIINIIYNRINFSNYRWCLKEYFFFILDDLNLLKKNYILNYYSWLNVIKNNIYNIKFLFIYYVNLIKYLKNLKKIFKQNNININLIIKKKLYNILYKKFFLKFVVLLKYYNKFFNNVNLYVNLNLKKYDNKNLIWKSAIFNIIDNSKNFAPVTITDFFWFKYRISKNIGLLLKDRLFKRTQLYTKDTLKNKIILKTVMPLSLKKNDIEQDIFCINYNNAYFFTIKKKKYFYNNVGLLKIFFFFYYYFLKFKFLFFYFFNYLKVYKYNSFFLINIFYKNCNNLNIYLRNQNNGNFFYLINKSLKTCMYYFYLFNFKLLILNIGLLNLNILSLQLKIFIKKLYLKFLNLKFLFYIFFFIFVVNNLLFVLKFIIIYFLKKKYKNFNNFITNINILNNNIFKNVLNINNLLNKNSLNEYNLDLNKYKFFYNLNKNYIYANYSKKRNLNNNKKCILFFIEKKSNIFLVLTKFKANEVIGHISGGQGMDRDFVNSKRQKKGTRSLTNSLETKLKYKIKVNKLKMLYIIAQGTLNFRIEHLMKYWVLRYKLGIEQLKGVKFLFRTAHHKGLKKSNKRRK